MSAPCALVTGASRGIGKATAIALARSGFDVAITARTVTEGTGRDDSDVGGGRAIPGSLEATAAEIAATGQRSLSLVGDLFDRESLIRAVARTGAAFGRLDVLVNNAVDTGPGSMLPFDQLSEEILARKLEGNVVAQFSVITAALPWLLTGGGVIINVTSNTATATPKGKIGNGGWGLAYAASKAAFHRFAPLLAVEYGDQGITAFNVDPGFVETERQVINADALGLKGHYVGAPPSVPAAAIAFLATNPSSFVNGDTIRAQKVALEQGLHDDWRGT